MMVLFKIGLVLTHVNKIFLNTQPALCPSCLCKDADSIKPTKYKWLGVYNQVCFYKQQGKGYHLMVKGSKG